MRCRGGWLTPTRGNSITPHQWLCRTHNVALHQLAMFTAMGSALLPNSVVLWLCNGLALGLIGGIFFLLPPLLITKFPGRAYPAWERVRVYRITTIICHSGPCSFSPFGILFIPTLGWFSVSTHSCLYSHTLVCIHTPLSCLLYTCCAISHTCCALLHAAP